MANNIYVCDGVTLIHRGGGDGHEVVQLELIPQDGGTDAEDAAVYVDLTAEKVSDLIEKLSEWFNGECCDA